MLKKTSKAGLVAERSVRPPWAFLADFDIDGATLKRLHKRWLDERIVAAVKAKAHVPGVSKVRLTGRASQTGSDAHNHWLSNERVRSVWHYILAATARLPVVHEANILGESAPAVERIEENEMDRSVEVQLEFVARRGRRVIPPRLIDIPEYKKWPPADKEVVDFTLQVLAADFSLTTVGTVPLFEKGPLSFRLFIEIKERGNGESALYEMEGSGSGSIISTAKLPRLNEWSQQFKKGKVHRFATTIPMDAEDFGGSAAFRFDNRLDQGAARRFDFGPTVDWLRGPEVTIKNLSLGKPADLSAFISGAEEGIAGGTLKRVASRPSWAR